MSHIEAEHIAEELNKLSSQHVGKYLDIAEARLNFRTGEFCVYVKRPGKRMIEINNPDDLELDVLRALLSGLPS